MSLRPQQIAGPLKRARHLEQRSDCAELDRLGTFGQQRKRGFGGCGERRCLPQQEAASAEVEERRGGRRRTRLLENRKIRDVVLGNAGKTKMRGILGMRSGAICLG